MKTYKSIKEFGRQTNLKTFDLNRLNTNIEKFTSFINGPDEFMIGKEGNSRITKNCAKELLECFNKELESRTWTPTETTDTAQETDVPATIEEIPIPTMAKETAPETSNTDETNVKKVLHKKSTKTVAKPKKINYINNTNKTKTTKTGDKTMFTKNEIAKIAPVAVKNILAAQKTNKTDIKKTYWGGWSTVRNGMNAAYNDYEKYQNLETEWLELRQKLGGTKSPLYHFCWKLINKNRVGVKQEPNATLRFIKNAKIRIAMANDVLANQKKYKNEIAENWKSTFGTEL